MASRGRATEGIRRRAALALVPALLIGVASACGSGPGGTPAAGTGCAGSKVRVGLVNSASDAPLFVSDKKGYFKDEGLAVEFSMFDSAAKMIAPLGGGQLDVGGGAPSAGFYNAVARDVDLRIVADKGTMNKDYPYMPLMVRKDLVDSGRVKQIGDLKGMRIAEPAQATATSSALNTILTSAGVAYEDVKLQYIGFGEHATAYANKAIDASMTTEPSATVVEKQGLAVRFALPPDYYGPQQLAVILYSATFAKNRQPADCFMRAYLRGVRDYLGAFSGGTMTGPNADEVVQIVTSATGLKPDLYRQVVPNYIHPDGALDVQSLQKDYDFFRSKGLLEGEPVALDKIIDRSFAEAAAQRLGPYAPPSGPGAPANSAPPSPAASR